jgi:hypothetical protein
MLPSSGISVSMWCVLNRRLAYLRFLESTASTSAASAISAYDMINNIRSVVAPYGPLRSIKVYWDYASYSDQSVAMRIRGQLSSSGVCLIDCPAEGRQAAATKKMLGMLSF